jgi:1,4-alpha-glucan branching enzyme
MAVIFSSPEFEALYTYNGNDLGANWSKEQTFFRLWAPTAKAVQVNLYRTGNPDAKDLIQSVPVYHLACTMNESAVIALEEALFPERYERNE